MPGMFGGLRSAATTRKSPLSIYQVMLVDLEQESTMIEVAREI
jgi:hypothetical protein